MSRIVTIILIYDRHKPRDYIRCMLHCFRVFKKSAPNNKLTIYLSSRDLVISDNKIDRLQGVLLVDPDYLQDRKVSHDATDYAIPFQATIHKANSIGFKI
jgi:hypothetical protein